MNDPNSLETQQKHSCYFFLAGGPRKLKRVSDVNALGQPTIPAPQPYAPNPYGAAPESAFVPPGPGSANVNFDPVPGLQTPQQTNMNYSSYNTGTPGPIPYDSYVNPGPAAPFANPAQEPYNPQPRVPGPTAPGAGQFAMFQQPIVQDMALQYGQRLADQGKQLVESHFEKYVPVTRLKYYFAVDSKYVVNKLRLIFFPFTHKVSRKCEWLQTCNAHLFSVMYFSHHRTGQCGTIMIIRFNRDLI